jgi:D-threo-aldose 1-dehydrogenase
MKLQPLGKSGPVVPPIVFGTSCLGNLYQALPWATKLAILREFLQHVPAPVVLDCAGKYGAGLALEVIGRGLRELGIAPDQVLVSNKLAWAQVPLRGSEPTFEPGAWADLTHDAEQRISYEGILSCWEQGCQLLGAPLRPRLVSVHDPDEYLAKAGDAADRRHRMADILGAYRALHELKAKGLAAAVGVGAKDWTVIRELAEQTELDWVMLACSLTIYHHPPELLEFVSSLQRRGIGIINSAVFHAGFLTGGSYFDYRKLDPANPADASLFRWRESFFAQCKTHGVNPAAACVQFGMTPPGVNAIALNTSNPARVRENVDLVQTSIPATFWRALKGAGLIAKDYPYAG